MGIIGVSEIRWEGSGMIKEDGRTFYYSGDIKGKNGVGILVKEEVGKSVEKVFCEGDRIIAARISSTPKCLFVVQVYMPTSDYEDSEIEEMYE